MGRASVGTPSSRAGHGRYAEGSVAETWDSIADWYAALVRGGSAMHEFSRDILLSVLPPTLPGGHVFDVGCGEGILSRAIAVRGATVVGLDPTMRLIAHAQAAEQAHPTGATYRRDDGQTLSVVDSESMDWVTAALSLNKHPRSAHRYRIDQARTESGRQVRFHTAAPMLRCPERRLCNR
jgi:ubiquinone/menaquinone biosynthesis C-methylase UbiE